MSSTTTQNKEVKEKPDDSSREQYPVTDLAVGVVGWDSQQDPDNPRLANFCNPFASSVFAGGISSANKTFNNKSSILSSLGVTAYLFGYFSGPLFFSPMSEIYGRRLILNCATSFFVLFQIGCALAPNISALIVFRLLTGFGGSACLTIGGGVVSDLFEPEQRGLAMSVFSFGPLFGPVLGPICGGFIAEGAGWRWIFWVLLISGGTLTGLVMIFNRETNPVILIQRKTVKMRKDLDRSELRSVYDDKASKTANRTAVLLHGLTMPLRLLFQSSIVALIAIYIAVVYGCLYLLFTTVTDVFQTTYHWSIQISGLAYIGLGVGFLTGQATFGVLSDRMVVQRKRKNNGVFEPEMRLPLCIIFAFFVPVSFFWYGWSVQAKTHWIVPIIGLFPFAFGLIGIFGTLQTYVIDCYPRYAASGVAAITITRSLFGALLPLAGPYMYNALDYGWGNSLLGFVTLALIPVPFIFNRVGARLRQNSSLDK